MGRGSYVALLLVEIPCESVVVHAAATEFLGAPLPSRSVKGILSAHTIGGDKRFRRVRHGMYELARETHES
jgi:hypothetical protein